MKIKMFVIIACLWCVSLPAFSQGSLMVSTMGASTLTHSHVEFGIGYYNYAYAFADMSPIGGYGGAGQFPASINVAGVNSISVTWNAPAGYMYVVTPPPATNGSFVLRFSMAYGFPGGADSLGTVTESSALFTLVYGAASASGAATIHPLPGAYDNGLSFYGGATITPGMPSFAFTSFTITAQFNGASPSGILNAMPFYNFSPPAPFDIVMYGGQYDLGNGYHGAPDPGPLLTLQPVPSPEPSTLALTGAASLLYFASRKMRSA